MSERLRQPLYQAPQPAGEAVQYADSPAPALESMYRQVWETSMHDMPFVNNALSVAAIGFCRHEGDWVGAVVTPWFLNLYVLPGGGRLWSDLASGDRVKVVFPAGKLEFIADYDPGGAIPAYQYCPLFQPVSQFATQDAAVAAAEAALEALFVEAEPAAAATEPALDPDLVALPAEPGIPSRRAFFKGLAGRRS